MEVTSEAEARQIMVFLNDMTEQVKKDAEQEKSILGTKVTYYDASKVCFEMEQHLEELGYESILDEYRPNIE